MADNYPRFVCPNQCHARFKGTANVQGSFEEAYGTADVEGYFNEEGQFVEEIEVENTAVDDWNGFSYDGEEPTVDDLEDELTCSKCGETAIDTEDMDDTEVAAALL